jgi:prepilin-type N-terminal cleavage/methylation domain-containing protein
MRITKRDGFSLIELMIVVIIVGIVAALVMLNATANETVDVQVTAKRVIRSIHSLRSAWLAYQADNFELLGVPSFNINDPSVKRALERYSDRKLDDDIARYGSIDIRCERGTGANSNQERIYLGFKPSAHSTFGNAEQKDRVIDILETDPMRSDYNLVKEDGHPYDGDANSSIMIRVW